MTKKEIEKRIEEIEEKIWWINIADRLDGNDRQKLYRLYDEKRELIKELKKA